MSVLKWLWNSSTLLKKNVTPVATIRTLCTEPDKKETKYVRGSDLFILPAERQSIDFDTKLRYMKSEAYKKAYGNLPVWTVYVRNFKGNLAPPPRQNCIWGKRLSSRNPCPICRDKYLIVDYRNVDLLKQFISPYGGEIISNRKTGICQKQHTNLLIAILKARNLGLLSYPVPFRRYDYNLYNESID